MSEFIGVLPAARMFDSPFLKRHALIFRRLVIPGAMALRDDEAAEVIADYEWLLSRDIISEPEKPLSSHWSDILDSFRDDPTMKAIKGVEIGPAEFDKILKVLVEHGIEPDNDQRDGRTVHGLVR